MTRPEQYLHAAKAEELAVRLASEGYSVSQEVRVGDLGWDLVASKGGRRIAIQVKLASALKASRDEIKRLRDLAVEHGFDEFRLVVVSPPRAVEVDIERLEAEVLRYVRGHMPEELAEISPGATAADLTDIQVDAVAIRREGIHVRGTGALQVETPSSAEAEGARAVTMVDVCPLTFEVDLDHQLRVVNAQKLEADVSSLRD